MHSNLSCNIDICMHNMNGLCSAAKVHITGISAKKSSETECDTFVHEGSSHKGFADSVVNLKNTNLTGELKQMFTNSKIQLSPRLVCDAIKCEHNQENKCSAKYVQIHGESVEKAVDSECETFKLK